MKVEQKIASEIRGIIEKLVETGICDDFNYPSPYTSKYGEIHIEWKNCENLSVSLKNLDYDTIYNELSKNRQYNLKLADGMMIQLLYKVKNNKIVSHRLSMFPSRNLECYQNEPELYEMDCVFSDVLAKNVVTFPVRFDYDIEDKPDHPNSHLSLGQYKNCRIPVYGPIMPNTFINFVLKNFYNSFFKEKIGSSFKTDYPFEYTIKDSELHEIHMYIS